MPARISCWPEKMHCKLSVVYTSIKVYSYSVYINPRSSYSFIGLLTLSFGGLEIHNPLIIIQMSLQKSIHPNASHKPFLEAWITTSSEWIQSIDRAFSVHCLETRPVCDSEQLYIYKSFPRTSCFITAKKYIPDIFHLRCSRIQKHLDRCCPRFPSELSSYVNQRLGQKSWN